MRFLSILAASLLFATAAKAHTGVGATSGLTSGILHPINGLDHVLAMVGVGLLGFMLGGKARWVVPTAFLGMMMVGGLIGQAGVNLPFVEVGIALSVVVIGASVVFGSALPLTLAMALAGGFAVFHGFAHAAEMPATVSGLSYGFGFLTATAFLHATGIVLGYGIDRAASAYSLRLTRVGGALLSVSGLALLGGVL